MSKTFDYDAFLLLEDYEGIKAGSVGLSNPREDLFDDHGVVDYCIPCIFKTEAGETVRIRIPYDILKTINAKVQIVEVEE